MGVPGEDPIEHRARHPIPPGFERKTVRRLTPVVRGSEQPRHAVSETQACGDRQRPARLPESAHERALSVPGLPRSASGLWSGGTQTSRCHRCLGSSPPERSEPRSADSPGRDSPSQPADQPRRASRCTVGLRHVLTASRLADDFGQVVADMNARLNTAASRSTQPVGFVSGRR